jgi:hypothetical protein
MIPDPGSIHNCWTLDIAILSVALDIDSNGLHESKQWHGARAIDACSCNICRKSRPDLGRHRIKAATAQHVFGNTSATKQLAQVLDSL